jgi:O-acetyl-ADP-ribose deacetylase (regulator of RNase III)
MKFEIISGDITKMEVDAVVNAANPSLIQGGGVCGAIFKAAGKKELRKACRELAPIKCGEAVITPAFKLPAKYIVHTAGVKWESGLHSDILENCYFNSLQLAVKNSCKSVAFPLISSGIYGWPKEKALEVAKSAITKFLKYEHSIDVFLLIL